MSSANIFDASAILAYLQDERGSDILDPVFDAGGQVTAVNYCEVLGKLIEKGMPPLEAQSAFADLSLEVVDFDANVAQHAAAMKAKTKPIGSSLGDRACLALAEHLSQSHLSPIVFTAEQAWTKLKWPFKITVIRPAKAGN